MLRTQALLVFGATAFVQTTLTSATSTHVRRADAACNAAESLGAVDPHWDDGLNRCVFWDCQQGYVMVDNWGVPFADAKRTQFTTDKSTMELVRCTQGTKTDCGPGHTTCTDPDPTHLSYCASMLQSLPRDSESEADLHTSFPQETAAPRLWTSPTLEL